MVEVFYESTDVREVLRAARSEGAVPLGAPLLHPVALPVIARALGWTPAEVREVAAMRRFVDGDLTRPLADDTFAPEGSYGIDAIVALIERRGLEAEGVPLKELLIDRAPPPPNPENEAWIALSNPARTLVAYRERGMPRGVLAEYAREVQERFDELMERWSEEAPATAWRPSRGERKRLPLEEVLPWAEWERPAPAGRASSAVWASDERLVVTRGADALVIDPTTGALRARFSHGGLMARTCDETGRFLVLTKPEGGDGVLDVEGTPAALLVYDLEEGRFAREYPDGMPAIVSQVGEPEHFWFYDHCTDRSLVSPTDGFRTYVYAYSRAFRVAWVGDGPEHAALWDLHEGRPVSAMEDVLADAPRAELAMDAGAHAARVDEDVADPLDWETEPDEGAAAYALARGADGRWCASTRAWCVFGDALSLRIGFDVHAAAFDPSAERVALITRGRAVIADRRGHAASLRVPELD